MESENITPEEPIVEPAPTPLEPAFSESVRVIFRNQDGGVSVLVPNPWAGLTIEQIAAKDVPAGAPFRIVDVSDIPSDRTFRNAWEFSE